jgi:predicted extracellular nuclease
MFQLPLNSATSPTLTITSPSNNAQIYSSDVNIQYTTTNFVVGTDGKIKYTINGTNPNYTVDNPILLSGLTQGTYNVQLELVDMNQNSLTPPVTASVSFTITSTLPQYVSIYDIQYTTDQTGNSPYADDTVQTSGIVTGTYAQGFFMQNGSGEWNGIYVFSATYAPQVSMGDSITIVGKVKEYYGLTEITNLSYLQVHSQNNSLPSPVVVTAAQVKSEPYEGVLVKLMNATCINENSGYGMWTVQDATDTCKIHNLLYTYTPTLNHKYHITGPVYYSYGEYRMNLVQ